MKSLKKLCEHYFNLFNEQNLDGIHNLFSDNIKLVDWDNSVKGKDEVISKISKLFGSVDDIKVNIKELIEEDDKVCCQISISIKSNNITNVLEVVDIITFDDLMKIKKIKAYSL